MRTASGELQVRKPNRQRRLARPPISVLTPSWKGQEAFDGLPKEKPMFDKSLAARRSIEPCSSMRFMLPQHGFAALCHLAASTFGFGL